MAMTPTYFRPHHGSRRGLAASLLVGALLLAVSCTPPGAGVSSSQRTIDLTRQAKVKVDPGTSKVLGSVRVPRALLNGETNGALDDLVMVPNAKLRLVDEQGSAFADVPDQTTDAEGSFTFPKVPLGNSMTLRADVVIGGKTLRLSKVLRPSEDLTCAHVDLATTLVADRLLGASPLLATDPGLEGADLYNLFIPSRMLEVEAKLRAALKGQPQTALTPLVAQLEQGRTGEMLEQFGQADSLLTQAYMEAFERPDAGLSVNIRTSAVGTNSIGVEARKLVFGIVNIKVEGAPDKTARMEYWAKSDTQQKIAESTTAGTWDATFDSWSLANGDLTLDTIAILDSGKKVLVGRSYLTIQNTLANVCPLP